MTHSKWSYGNGLKNCTPNFQQNKKKKKQTVQTHIRLLLNEQSSEQSYLFTIPLGILLSNWIESKI